MAERIDTVTNDWGLTDNYHEFAFGLPRDAEGNLYFSLNLAFLDPEWFHGQSNAKHRGWLLRVTPEGIVERVAMGFRSPCGVGIDAEGRVLVTDNQGDWMASSPIFAVSPGNFHGHPASLAMDGTLRQRRRRIPKTSSHRMSSARRRRSGFPTTGRGVPATWYPT